MLQAESAHPFQLKLQGIDAEPLTLSNLVLQFFNGFRPELKNLVACGTDQVVVPASIGSNIPLPSKFCQTQHKQHIVGFEN